MRAFFGLELDANTAIQIADWRDRQLACAGRPVPPANFHITLAFVGDMPISGLERLSQSVDAWVARETVPGADLDLNQTGYWHKTGIYWLGPQRWPDSLSLLAGKLRGLATGAGGKRDRNAFQPHVTLLRRCSAAPPAPARVPAIALTYQHFTLFESRQGKQGVTYHPIQNWDLPAPVP